MSRLALALLALAALLAPPAAAQKLPLSASLYHRVEGDVLQAAIEIRIDPGWHLYHETLGPEDAVGLPTKATFAAEGVEWGAVEFPEPEREEQPGLGDDGGDTWIWTHHGKIVLRAEGELALTEAPESVEAELRGLVCEADGTCLPVALELRSKGAGPDRLFPAAESAPEAAASEAAAPSIEPAPEPSFESAGGFGMPGEEEGTEVTGRFWTRREGDRVHGLIRLQIAEGWHLYHDELGAAVELAQPTVVAMEGEGVRWGRVVFPAPKPYTDALGESTLVHDGSIDLRVSGEVLEGAEPSGLGARVDGQVCSSSLCLPVELELESEGPGADAAFAWTAGGAAVPAEGGADPQPGDAGVPIRGGEEKSLLAFLLLAVGGGLFALMMPCTYPMIPITISFFTKQADARGGKVLPLALAYGAGIVLIFIAIGVVIGPVVIAFATHPVTNLVIGLLFLLFAVVLFGAIDLQPPRFLMDAAGKASMHGGYFGVFLMGVTLVVSSFTCTAPFVGSLLSFGAVEGGSLVRVALGMGVFGLTMAVPFVFLSLLPGKVQAMPRSGEWMNTLKVTLGFVEVAAALKFFSNSDVSWEWNILSLEFFLQLWAAIFVVCAAYLFGWIRLKGHDAHEVTPGRMTAALGMLLFALYCWNGTKGGELDAVMTAIAPPYSRYEVEGGFPGESVARSRRATHAFVEDDYESARAQAEAEGKLLLVNFTGHTCVNCRQMERKVFPDPEVAPILQGMVEARLHTDGVLEPEVTEHINELREKWTRSVANPIYLVMDPADERILGRQDGGSSAEEFAAFLTDSASRSKVARR